MTYLTRAVVTGVFITLLIWFGTGFVAGTLDVMSFAPGARFAMFVFWLFFQVVNAVAWACAHSDSEY